jgi:phenolic acid decarboxylase
MPVLPSVQETTFDTDLRNRHLIYDYDAKDQQGNPEKWRYEIWFYNEDRIVYAIHGGPMAGRKNFQTATYQCIRPGELWQVNWLEETGTICSAVYDIPRKQVTGLLGFSKGHWEHAEVAAHGDKRNPQDFARWRELAKLGIQTERHMLSEQAHIVHDFRGPGDLEGIDMSWPTL